MRKTKEYMVQIWEFLPEGYRPNEKCVDKNQVLELMDEYADQEMEAFLEWAFKNYEAPWVSPNGHWYCPKGANQDKVWKNRTYLTTQQLIAKYKEEQNG